MFSGEAVCMTTAVEDVQLEFYALPKVRQDRFFVDYDSPENSPLAADYAVDTDLVPLT